MKEKIEQLRMGLRAVLYKEDKYWIAHCLEMDVMGHGRDKKTAFLRMNEAIAEQIAQSVRLNNRANIFQPADARYFEMFAAGRDAIKGLATIRAKLNGHPSSNIFVEPVQAREFQGQYAMAS